MFIWHFVRSRQHTCKHSKYCTILYLSISSCKTFQPSCNLPLSLREHFGATCWKKIPHFWTRCVTKISNWVLWAWIFSNESNLNFEYEHKCNFCWGGSFVYMFCWKWVIIINRQFHGFVCRQKWLHLKIMLMGSCCVCCKRIVNPIVELNILVFFLGDSSLPSLILEPKVRHLYHSTCLKIVCWSTRRIELMMFPPRGLDCILHMCG